MEENERIVVTHYSATCYKYDPVNGVSAEVNRSWDIGDLPVDGRFDYVREAIEGICDANEISFRKENWHCEADGTFHGKAMLDGRDNEASDYDIEQWNDGRLNLYVCRLVATLKVVSERSLTEDELEEWR